MSLADKLSTLLVANALVLVFGVCVCVCVCWGLENNVINNAKRRFSIARSADERMHIHYP
jgi:hypothetical protein